MFAGFEQFFQEVQKAALPAVWSKGVTLVRAEASIVCDSQDEEEVLLRLLVKNQAVSPRVKLFPQEQQWDCDCESDDDPCAHVAASMIAIKQGRTTDVTSAISGQASELSDVGHLVYRFRTVPMPAVSRWSSRSSNSSAGVPEPLLGLALDRYIVAAGREQKLTQNLRSYVAGQNAGRVDGLKVAASKSDFAVDLVLGNPSEHPLDRQTLLKLVRTLESFDGLTLDAKPLRCSTQLIGTQARLIDDGVGWRLLRFQKLEIEKKFSGGFVLAGNRLHPVEHSKLTPQEDEALTTSGRYYPPEAAYRLASEILPALELKIPVEVLSKRLPRRLSLEPRIVLSTEVLSNFELSVVARLVYGEKGSSPLAYVQDQRLIPLAESGKNLRDSPPIVIQRNESEERQLLQKLQRELQLQSGRPVEFGAHAALEFMERAKGWEIEGEGLRVFCRKPTLEPQLIVEGRRFEAHFGIQFEGKSFSADPARVFQAWRDGHDSVPLIEGGWAQLPRDWLRRFGKTLQNLLEARDENRELAPHQMPELARVFEEVGQVAPISLQKLREKLENFSGIPEYPLPADLQATLRSYQRAGVNWLCFLRESNLGGLLADDMGLGKTLQAICALKGRSLVVAPTSVLHNWASELERFRPSLRVSVYHGGQRELSKSADVILTTYALARIDQDLIAAEIWETVVLDEAQNIKNPHSQVSRAIHRIQADFRITLSGTPIENRLDDLWSQFQFVNPGFLGSYENFQESYVRPIARADLKAAERLRTRVKPFILRRLKREVAPELPPRTESVLRAELSREERDVYESVLAATRKEVVAKLSEGKAGSMMQALEALLRLRQACCHRALLPGQLAKGSSKVDLLLETLQESLEEGHRSLIFSQWTSYLDLIAAELAARNIRYSRIDGSTQDRSRIVQEFQASDGPPLMLLSLKAGGVGLTLTAADHVFIMDPWWNPSVEDQAADRAHRIGQENPVLIHRLICSETVEEKILILQKKKQDLARSVLDGAEGASSLSREDIMELLS